MDAYSDFYTVAIVVAISLLPLHSLLIFRFVVIHISTI
jgi:hypothetical protein